MSSVVISGDISGSVTLDAPAVAGTTVLTLPATSGTVLTSASATVGANGITFSDGSTQTAAASPFSLKNRIINGDMVIDQRNNGAEVNPAVNGAYYLDRWRFNGTQPSRMRIGRNAGSVTPPAGFANYLGLTSLSAYSVLASDFFFVVQFIEGFNTADLAWGTANARTVTLSFWARSSLTGTFGATLINGTDNRSYPATYTISAANTWEYKTITIPGDTTGTWATGNTTGIAVIFGLGVGSTYSGTAGAWSGSLLLSATGATSVVGTNGATFYITGVQLERNTTATPFEWLPYTTELQLCQRYYNRWSGANVPYIGLTTCSATGTTAPSTRRASWANPVDFRSQPTMGFGGTIQLYTAGLSNLGFTGFNGTTSNKNIISFDINSSSAGTAGQALMLIIDSAIAANYIDASAEL